MSLPGQKEISIVDNGGKFRNCWNGDKNRVINYTYVLCIEDKATHIIFGWKGDGLLLH